MNRMRDERGFFVKGHPSAVTAEGLKKISLALKGKKRKPMTAEHRKNIGLAQIGRVPWNKGIEVEQRGEKHPNWHGGRRKHMGGYIELYQGVGKRKLEHRLVMEKIIGRELHTYEFVHHINEIKTDNRIENLMIVTPAEHRRLHSKAAI